MTCPCRGGKEWYSSLVEMAIMNRDNVPDGYRCFRIEYGFECSCPEGIIYLPSHIDVWEFEQLLNDPKKMSI